MSLVLDASVALAWLFKRVDPAEFLLAEQALDDLTRLSVTVPAIWFSEVANSLLRGERQGVVSHAQTTFFINELSQAAIEMDEELPSARQTSVIDIARIHGLTAYDATYLDLAMRRAAALATFDRKLAGAARAAGVRVFGDPA